MLELAPGLGRALDVWLDSGWGLGGRLDNPYEDAPEPSGEEHGRRRRLDVRKLELKQKRNHL